MLDQLAKDLEDLTREGSVPELAARIESLVAAALNRLSADLAACGEGFTARNIAAGLRPVEVLTIAEWARRTGRAVQPRRVWTWPSPVAGLGVTASKPSRVARLGGFAVGALMDKVQVALSTGLGMLSALTAKMGIDRFVNRSQTKTLDDHEKRLRALEDKVARMDERLKAVGIGPGQVEVSR